MVGLNNKSKKLQLLTLLIPLFFSVLTLVLDSMLAAVIWAVSVVCIITFVPVFDKRESLWAFLCMAITGIPANIYFTDGIMNMDILLYIRPGFFYILYAAMVYAIVFSIGQIAVGFIIRFFHPKQYKLNV